MKHFAPDRQTPFWRSIEAGVFENSVQADSGMAVLGKQAKADTSRRAPRLYR
jgi:hypothetical protein